MAGLPQVIVEVHELDAKANVARRDRGRVLSTAEAMEYWVASDAASRLQLLSLLRGLGPVVGVLSVGFLQLSSVSFKGGLLTSWECLYRRYPRRGASSAVGHSPAI